MSILAPYPGKDCFSCGGSGWEALRGTVVMRSCKECGGSGYGRLVA